MSTSSSLLIRDAAPTSLHATPSTRKPLLLSSSKALLDSVTHGGDSDDRACGGFCRRSRRRARFAARLWSPSNGPHHARPGCSGACAENHTGSRPASRTLTRRAGMGAECFVDRVRKSCFEKSIEISVKKHFLAWLRHRHQGRNVDAHSLRSACRSYRSRSRSCCRSFQSRRAV